METLNNLFIYLTRINPSHTFNFYLPLTIFVVILAGFSIGLRFYLKKHKKNKPLKRLFKRYPSKIFNCALLLGLYVLSRYYSIAFFSMRLVLYIILAVTAYIIYKMIRAYLKQYPEEQKNYHHQMAKNRYMIKNH